MDQLEARLRRQETIKSLLRNAKAAEQKRQLQETQDLYKQLIVLLDFEMGTEVMALPDKNTYLKLLKHCSKKLCDLKEAQAQPLREPEPTSSEHLKLKGGCQAATAGIQPVHQEYCKMDIQQPPCNTHIAQNSKASQLKVQAVSEQKRKPEEEEMRKARIGTLPNCVFKRTRIASPEPPPKGAAKASMGFQTAADLYQAELRKRGGGGAADADAESGDKIQAPPASNGPVRGRGSRTFVPPLKKQDAAQQPKEDAEPGLSKRTLDLLVGSNGELPESLKKLDANIVEMVCQEIMDTKSNLQWEDIAGQDDAKRLVQELVVWPMLNPNLFKGVRAPPKGLLLFGPPGTGKTLIGRAIASNIKATFFNISAGSLTSKWIGEGEKMVRALFAVAAALQPAVIFIDEIDSILSARRADGEHESSRRLKTELLVQIEGVDPSGVANRILLVGATNRPEELDEAARRRMPKQLYIPLPCSSARESMLRRALESSGGVLAALSDTNILKIVEKTDGYSGSDMRNLIQEACQGPVRDAVQAHGQGVAALSEQDLRPVNIKDFQVAARAQRASVDPSEVLRYEAYDAKHGARYTQSGGNATSTEEEDW